MTNFEKKVYRVVLTIPFGETRSYGWVAERVGSPGAVRAVGGALGKNPFVPLVPCRRVIRADGSLGGYVNGEQAKRELLNNEREILLKLDGEFYV